MKANRDLILTPGEEGIGNFGPAVDGHYVPDIPIRLLYQGRYHRDLKSLISSNVCFEVRYPPQVYTTVELTPSLGLNPIPYTRHCSQRHV